MRGSGHQEKVPGEGSEQAPQLEPLGFIDLGPIPLGGKLVGFVDDHEIPGGADLKFLMQLFPSRQLVQTSDEEILLIERVPGMRSFLHLPGEDIKGEPELFEEFFFPLFDQTAGSDDKHPPGICTHDEFANVEPGHDGFACPRIVSKDKSKRLAGEEGIVDSRYLVREGLYIGGVNRHHWVEEVSEVDAVGFGNQLEFSSWGIERPGSSDLGQSKVLLVGSKEHSFKGPAISGLIVKCQGIRTRWFGGNYPNHLTRFDPGQRRILLYLFESNHWSRAIVTVSRRSPS